MSKIIAIVVPCDKACCVDVSWEVTVDCVVAKADCSVVVSVVRSWLWLPSDVDCAVAWDDWFVVVVVRSRLWLPTVVEWGVDETVVVCVDVTKVRTLLSIVNDVRIGVHKYVVALTCSVLVLVDVVNVVEAWVLVTEQRVRNIRYSFLSMHTFSNIV